MASELLEGLDRAQLEELLIDAKNLFKFEIVCCENCEKIFLARNDRKKFCSDTCRVYHSRGISRREPDVVREGKKKASNGMTWDEIYKNFSRWWLDYGNVRDYGQEIGVYEDRREWDQLLDYTYRRLVAENPGKEIVKH